MDAQMQLLWASIREEMEKQNREQTQTLTETINKTLEEHLSPIRMENEALRSEIKTLQSKVQYLQFEARKNNVIMHGVEEKEANNAELMSMVLELLNKTNDASNDANVWDKWEISNTYRIGKKSKNNKRPIKISFTLTWRRNEIMRNGKKLPKGVYIMEDLTKEELEKRKALLPQMKEARESGKYATIKNGKLIIKEKSEAEKRKRAPSSPLSTPPSNFSKASETTRVIQPAKITKTNTSKTTQRQPKN